MQAEQSAAAASQLCIETEQQVIAEIQKVPESHESGILA